MAFGSLVRCELQVSAREGATLPSRSEVLAEFYERLLGWPIVRRVGPRPGRPSTDGWALLRSPDGRVKIELQWEPHHRVPTWPSQQGDQTMMMQLDIGLAGATAAQRQKLYAAMGLRVDFTPGVSTVKLQVAPDSAGGGVGGPKSPISTVDRLGGWGDMRG